MRVSEDLDFSFGWQRRISVLAGRFRLRYPTGQSNQYRAGDALVSDSDCPRHDEECTIGKTAKVQSVL